MFRTFLIAAAVSAAAISTPEITAVSPATPTASAQSQTLMVTGKDFSTGLSVELRTPDAQTRTVTGGSVTFRSATAFDVPLLLDRAGDYTLKVTNTDGGVTPPFSFHVGAAKTMPAPSALAIDRVTPDAPVRSDQAQVLQLDGRGFENGLRVSVRDPSGAEVTDVTLGKVTPNSAAITVLLNQRGPYNITASTPNANSNAVTITVK